MKFKKICKKFLQEQVFFLNPVHKNFDFKVDEANFDLAKYN